MSKSTSNKPSLKDIATKNPSRWEVIAEADNIDAAVASTNEDFNFVVCGVAEAAAGDLPNDQMKTCKICTKNGFPHEPIFFEKIRGRVLADGANEVKGYRVVNYTDNSQHEHKDLWKDLAPKLWQQAMEGS
jgi:hypothetical protein